MVPSPGFWDLRRNGLADQRRHQVKVAEAMREHLSDWIADDSVIMGDVSGRVRIPMRTLVQYRFRYDPNQPLGVGQDQGQTQPGDVMGRDARQEAVANLAPGADPGEAWMEVDVGLEDLRHMVFQELELPHLEPKAQARWADGEWRLQAIRSTGLWGNMDKRRMLYANLLRQARRGERGIGAWQPDDLRFKVWDLEEVPSYNAVVIAMRDISGSMGEIKKRMVRRMAYWILGFLRHRYHAVELVFVVHHTQAREVTEPEFFQLGESGGTKVSSAYELCRDIIATRYPPSRWNVYPMHFSDGDNWSDADNRRTTRYLLEILPWVNLFGYVEIREGDYSSTLMNQFSEVHHPHFKMVPVSGDHSLLSALKTLFPKRNVGEVMGNG